MKLGLAKLAFAALSFGLSGCATSYGAQTVAPSGYNYNTAIAESLDQQLLLNLVRLRYRDTVVFMDITSVTTQHEYAAGISAENAIPFRRPVDGASVITPSTGYSETPTITYAPVSGSEFATNLLSPISAKTIVLLANSGWSIERLLNCCVERLGPLSNAPSASGPTPSSLPDNIEFRRLSELLRKLQTEEQVFVEQVASEGGGAPATYLIINAAPGSECDELKRLIGAASCQARLRLVEFSTANGPGTLPVRTRSVLGALYTLSHSVKAPGAHENAGWVTNSRAASPTTGSWQDFLGGQFQIESSNEEPGQAFVKINYRGHWFWIDDSDLDSKTTFNLMLFLLSLQSAASDGATPLLTIGAG